MGRKESNQTNKPYVVAQILSESNIQLMHSFEVNIKICQPENSDVRGLTLYMLYRGFYMSAHILLNLLNELGKRDKMRGLPRVWYSLFIKIFFSPLFISLKFWVIH